jgi:DNA-binding transcriptional LysR family regulator
MTIQQIHYAIRIAENGSFNKAAESLFLSQPSLTTAIHDLEDEIGIQIFHRSGRGVTITNDGEEFLEYARTVYHQFEMLSEKYTKGGPVKKKFSVSAQHYSFAVKSFVELVKGYNTAEYEFAFRETKTREVIEDVASTKSEIGILFLCDFNRVILQKLLHSSQLEFHKLIDCHAYVYLWKGHPLANQPSLRLEQLEPYPCLSFEQGDNSSFYFSEEILSTNEYPRTIKANDRATMLNLMVGLNSYMLCSGIICEELNGSDYTAIPFVQEEDSESDRMEIGYIVKKNTLLSTMAKEYIGELQHYLESVQDERKNNQ